MKSKIMFTLCSLLVVMAPIMAVQASSFMFWGEHECPAHLKNIK